MRHTSVADQQWHRNVTYPALSAESAQRLREEHAQDVATYKKEIDLRDDKIDRLQQKIDERNKRLKEQEDRILELEKHIVYLQSLTRSYEELIVAKHGYVIPAVPDPAEPFST